MKKIFTLLSIMPLASAAFGQITINSTDMPVPTAAYNLRDITTTAAANPTVGTSANWDYSTFAGTTTTNTYFAETNTFFTTAGIDVYISGFKSLIPGLGYDIFSEIDFNTTNVKESGIEIERQAYSLTSFTGGANDSLVFPAQSKLLPTAKEIIRFPFTANSTWSSVSRRVTDFNLTVFPAYSNTACQHAYYIHRQDSIKGWGKMKVYTASGPSIQYDVLMDKISQYAVDSFYIAGSAASSTILSVFGASQDQTTDSSYRYNFYRKGSFNYLMTFSYGSDKTYTTPVAKFAHTDNITPAGVNELGNVSYTTVLFPNPANGSEVNLLVNGKDVTGKKYIITDMAGKTIQAGTVEMLQGAVHVAIANTLANGNYFISIVDENNVKAITEQFTVAK